MCTDFSDRSCEVLDHIANLFCHHSEATGRIEAHCQPGAPSAIAKEICEARAEAVRSALVQRGVDSSRLRSGGFGTLRPLLGASDGANRRVEMFMILGDMQFPAEHLPVRVGGSAKWLAWLRGGALSAAGETGAMAWGGDDDSDASEEELDST
mmetsp:Transcript_49279/g.89034  ORF Transcript_49279/g.89034 Transcript_49279/m.89034 type:complete len:153 (-) Transcript_49279:140-598(-)